MSTGPDGAPKAKGRALPRTAADLDRLAAVSFKDVKRARQSWKARAPERFAGLMDAEARGPGDDDDDGTGG